MAGKTVKSGDLANAIMKELKRYTTETSVETKAVVKKVAKECKKEAGDNAKAMGLVRTGEYAKGFAVKTEYDGISDTRVIVYNKPKGPLTHLLEHGFNHRAGGRVEGKPHIAPAEAHAIESLEREIERIFKE